MLGDLAGHKHHHKRIIKLLKSNKLALRYLPLKDQSNERHFKKCILSRLLQYASHCHCVNMCPCVCVGCYWPIHKLLLPRHRLLAVPFVVTVSMWVVVLTSPPHSETSSVNSAPRTALTRSKEFVGWSTLTRSQINTINVPEVSNDEQCIYTLTIYGIKGPQSSKNLLECSLCRRNCVQVRTGDATFPNLLFTICILLQKLQAKVLMSTFRRAVKSIIGPSSSYVVVFDSARALGPKLGTTNGLRGNNGSFDFGPISLCLARGVSCFVYMLLKKAKTHHM